MSHEGSSQLNLESIYTARLELTQQERTGIKESLDVVDVKLDNGRKAIGKRPRRTPDEIDQAMKDLEHSHAINIQSRGDERAFMRELDKLKQEKKDTNAYNTAQQELDELKSQRHKLSTELREKDSTLDELHSGLRKLRLATQLGCGMSEIFDKTFVVPEDKVASIIGKGGKKLRELEDSCNVSINTERTGGDIRITGSAASIANAYALIMEIVSQANVEFSPSDETIVCLIITKSELSKEIEARHDVRVDVSRAKKLCKVTGHTNAVQNAIDEINSIDSARCEIPMDPSALPSVIGKGGSNIRALEDENCVQIDISREDNSIVVLGLRENVQKVATVISETIHENKEVEDTLKVNKQIILGCLIGPGGATAKSLQKELGVGIRSEKGEDGDPLDTLYIKGSYSKVIPAKQHILGLLQTYISQTEEVVVPQEMISYAVGKKGSRIKQIREAYPGVMIDIEGTAIRIQSTDEDVRKKVRAEFEEIIANNYTRTISMEQDASISLKTARGNEARKALTEMTVNLDIDTDNELVTLRGPKDNVEKAIEMLEAFKSANYAEEMSVDEDDCLTLITNSEADSIPKALEAEFSVEIRVSKKEGTVKVRGETAIVKQCIESLKCILKGDPARGSIVVEVDPASFSTIIGKGGANSKKFESSHNVKLDMMKAHNSVRIRGDPTVLDKAKLELIVIAEDVRSNLMFEVPSGEGSKDFGKISAQVESLFGVEVSKNGDIVTLKGNLKNMASAKEYILEMMSGVAVHTISLSGKQVLTMSPQAAAAVSRVAKKCEGVSVDFMPTEGCVKISGPSASALRAKAEIFKWLDTLLPGEFVSIAMPLACLQAIGSTKYLLETSASTGAVLSVDRVLSCMHVRGDPPAANEAAARIRTKMDEWSERHASIPIEEFMLPTLVGKAGANISAAEKANNVKMKINRAELKLEITGGSKDVVSAAVTVMTEKIKTLGSGFWEVTLGQDLIRNFIGKEGSNIKKIRSESGASVDVDNASNIVKASGDIDKVNIAKEKILDFIREETMNSFVIEVPVPPSAFSALMGSKGKAALEIHAKSGSRLDCDRGQCKVMLRGSEESCRQGAGMIREIIGHLGGPTEDEVSSAAGTVSPTSAVIVAAVQKQAVSVQAPVLKPVVQKEAPAASKPLVGAPPSLVGAAPVQQQTYIPTANLSKSALRRLRRKNRADVPGEAETDSALPTNPLEDVAQAVITAVQLSPRTHSGKDAVPGQPPVAPSTKQAPATAAPPAVKSVASAEPSPSPSAPQGFLSAVANEGTAGGRDPAPVYSFMPTETPASAAARQAAPPTAPQKAGNGQIGKPNPGPNPNSKENRPAPQPQPEPQPQPQPQPEPAAAPPNPKSSYYKSKSGLKVRL